MARTLIIHNDELEKEIEVFFSENYVFITYWINTMRFSDRMEISSIQENSEDWRNFNNNYLTPSNKKDIERFVNLLVFL